MKKQIKSLILSIGISLSVLFATTADAQVSLGVKAGINGATEPFTGYEHERLVLPYGGLYLQYRANWFGLQLGANYSPEGTNLENLNNGDTYHDRQTYLNVPLLLQGHFDFGGYIEFGAEYGFLLSSSSSFDGGPSVDTKQDYTSTNFSVDGGIGYEFNHKAKRGLGINVRYIRGLTSIAQSESFGDAVKMRVLSAALTYTF
jgi:hypothetical protein